MRYFENVSSIEELKQEYKKLVKRYHPDLNRDMDTTDIMKAVNAEYEAMFSKLSKDGSSEVAADFMDILNIVINLEGLDIEICGSWVWVSGDTYKHKDGLKAAGFKWASKKKMWYWHPEDAACKSNGKKSIEDIRNKYGSQKVASKQQGKLSA